MELERLTFSALGSPVFTKKPAIIQECKFLCLLSSFYNGDSSHAFNLVRKLVTKNVNSNSVWNLFNLVISRGMVDHRGLNRLKEKEPGHIAIALLRGHRFMLAGNYDASLGNSN